MKSVAIITARGGSKRIPRKNIRPFLGRPIIEYSIEAALQSGVFDEVMVSTDDEEIAEIAQKAGAEVPFSEVRIPRTIMQRRRRSSKRFLPLMKAWESISMKSAVSIRRRLLLRRTPSGRQ